MNLRIDLIMETEQRSASVVNTKTIKRVSIITVPVVVVAILLLSTFQLIAIKSEVGQRERMWQTSEPRQKKAEEDSRNVAKNRDLLAELKGISNSRNEWYRQLVAIHKDVPSDIVLETMRIEHSINAVDGKAAREFKITIGGKTFGENSEQSVMLLKKKLDTGDNYDHCIQSVEIPMFKADETPGADKNDRVFRMNILYKPRKFE